MAATQPETSFDLATAVTVSRPRSSFATRLAALLVAGLGLRLLLAATTNGLRFDLDSMRITYEALARDPLHVYRAVNENTVVFEGTPIPRWPYPPGYFPWILFGGRFSDFFGVPFGTMMRIPASVADVGLAWLVQDMLARRGTSERTRLSAAALVMLGFVFVWISGYHGQIDALAILPALAAVAVWERSPSGVRRAVIAGLLIGVGGVIKTVPFLMILALAPTVRSRKEAAVLVASVAALPLVTLAPFVLTEPEFVRASLSYRGLPWYGGFSLAVQPLNVVRAYGTEAPPVVSSAARLAADLGGLVALPGLLVASAVLIRRRVPPVQAAIVLWLVVYALAGNFFLHYLVWALPFLLVAGHLRWVLVVHVVALPLVVLYGDRTSTAVLTSTYIPAMLALWVGSCCALLYAAVVAARGRGASHARPG